MKEPKLLPRGTLVRTSTELNDDCVRGAVHAEIMKARRPGKEDALLSNAGGLYWVRHEGPGCSDFPAAYHYSEIEVVGESPGPETHG